MRFPSLALARRHLQASYAGTAASNPRGEGSKYSLQSGDLLISTDARTANHMGPLAVLAAFNVENTLIFQGPRDTCYSVYTGSNGIPKPLPLWVPKQWVSHYRALR
jgi:hypothetical protein